MATARKLIPVSAPVVRKRTRVRLEFTAIPGRTDADLAFQLGKKLSGLRILLGERAGRTGLKAFDFWLRSVASEREVLSTRKVKGGVTREKLRSEEVTDRRRLHADEVDG